MHGEQCRDAAHLIRQLRLGLPEQPEEGQHARFEVLADAQIAHRGLVLLHEAEEGRGRVQRLAVAAEQLLLGLQGPRLLLGPGDQLVHGPAQVLEQADDDVFLGLEVVVQRRLGDFELLRDLP